MTTKNYVIRGYHFGYNDECYYVTGAYNHGKYTNKEEAEAEYKKLEISAAMNLELEEVGSLFDNSELAEKASEFLKEHGGNWEDGALSSEMTDESILAFLDLIHWHSYKLIEFEGEPKFYALWWTDEESYDCQSDEEDTYVTFEAEPSDFSELIADTFGRKTFNGTLEELSDTPLLLEKLINSDPKIKYDENSKKLVIAKNNGMSWIALAELLKKPPFELRPLSLEQMEEVSREYSDHDY